MYIENLICPRERYEKLLRAFLRHEDESVRDNRAVCLSGLLTVYHDSYAKVAKRKNSAGRWKSVFTDFEALKLYGNVATKEDTVLYREVMGEIFKDYGYAEALEKYLAKKGAEDDE